MRLLMLLTILYTGRLLGSEPFITRIEGEVYILSSPSKVVKGEPPRLKYKNHYYNLKKAELGDQLTRLHIIKTGADGKAKLIYPNGDMINIGPGTMFKTDKATSQPKSSTILNLIIGKFRALLDPEGPRANTKIRTRSVAMGVRGTDFYVNTRNKKGETEVSVVRGEVRLGKDVKSLSAETGGNIAVRTGQFAEINVERIQDDISEAVILRQMAKADLIAINSYTGIGDKYGYGETMMALTSKPKSDLQKKLEKLEKLAAENMFEDIKRHEPDKIKSKQSPKTTDQIDYVK